MGTDNLLFFVVGAGVAIIGFWLWELMTRGGHRDFVRYLDDRVAPDKVSNIVEEIRSGQLKELDREQIWERMSWIWKEARLMALASNRLLAIPYLTIFLGVYIGLWFKTLLSPRSHDLRFLIAAETVLLSLVNRDDGSTAD